MRTRGNCQFSILSIGSSYGRICRLALLAVCVVSTLLLTSLLFLPSKAYASGPNTLPPQNCLTISLAVTNVHNVPLPKGTGTSYNIDMTVINNCPNALASGGTWSLVAKLSCLGQTALGFNLSGNLPAMNAGGQQNVVDSSRVAFCNDFVDGVLVNQFPPDQESYFGRADAHAVNGVAVTGQASASLFP